MVLRAGWGESIFKDAIPENSEDLRALPPRPPLRYLAKPSLLDPPSEFFPHRGVYCGVYCDQLGLSPQLPVAIEGEPEESVPLVTGAMTPTAWAASVLPSRQSQRAPGVVLSLPRTKQDVQVAGTIGFIPGYPQLGPHSSRPIS